MSLSGTSWFMAESLTGQNLGEDITTGADYSAVLGGKHTSVTHDYAYSMGYNIDSVSANTTHVDQLYAKNLPNGDPSMAGILYTRTGSQLGMSGSTHCLSSSFVMVSNG